VPKFIKLNFYRTNRSKVPENGKEKKKFVDICLFLNLNMYKIVPGGYGIFPFG